MNMPHNQAPVRIALVYAAAGTLWILLTDWLLLRLGPDALRVGQVSKGLVFVLLSAALIFVLVRRELRKRADLQREQETLNQRLAGSQRLESIGQLTAGIAHDFNNLLTAIIGNLESYLQTTEEEVIELTEATHAARRAEQLTRQLLAFGRRQDLRAEPLDLNGEVRELGQLLRRLIGPHVEIESRLADDLWVINVDRGRLQQVVMNLALNARDAMPAGGRLTLTTANTTIDDDDAAKFDFPVVPGEYVCLSVEDTGMGMDQQTRERIYEPFFTTKEKHSGTGLGMSTVYGVVKQTGGYIDLETSPGEGTCFDLYFPRGEGEPVRVAASAGALRVTEDTGTILVVEDEPAVRSLVVRTLRRHGFTTLESASGPEALELLDGPDEPPIDLLLTDAIMPGMTGIELIENVRRRHSTLPVLLMSGYTNGEIDADSPFLQKPFTADQLLTRIRELLSQPARP
jgi:signal transduction histidine kinase